MIRVPFLSFLPQHRMSEFRLVKPETSIGAVEAERHRAEQIEIRLSELELKLTQHAQELNSEISSRVLRIQSRIESALRPFHVKAESNRLEEEADNLVSFSEGEGRTKHQLYAHNAREAMLELNETLRITREHLDALSGSVERMRTSVSGR